MKRCHHTQPISSFHAERGSQRTVQDSCALQTSASSLVRMSWGWPLPPPLKAGAQGSALPLVKAPCGSGATVCNTTISDEPALQIPTPVQNLHCQK